MMQEWDYLFQPLEFFFLTKLHGAPRIEYTPEFRQKWWGPVLNEF